MKILMQWVIILLCRSTLINAMAANSVQLSVRILRLKFGEKNKIQIMEKKLINKKVLMKGNEALAEAAIQAGCRFYAGYPITPQNEVPEYMSQRMPEVKGIFIQSERELAAINMIFGASATGARAMTSSSSPGTTLKQEGISYLAGAE